MIDNTDFFEMADNFTATAHVVSIPVFEAKLKSPPEITVAIPTYRRAEYLKETVESAINQSGDLNYDIIVVDNNPERNDETEKIMSAYRHNPIVSYYKNAENIQMTGNWNRLYVLAKGKYVVMLHDDDLLYPNYLSSIYPIVEKSEYDMYFPQFVKYDMQTEKSLPVQSGTELKCAGVKTADFMYDYITGAPIGMCVKRELFIETGGFSPRYYPSFDYDYTAKVSNRYKVCKIVGYPVSIYRIADNSSRRTEILLACVKCDIAIKKGIIANKNILVKKMWNSHIKVYSFHYLERMKRSLHNDRFDAREELSKMGITYNILDMLVYKSINYQHTFAGIMKSVKNKLANLRQEC